MINIVSYIDELCDNEVLPQDSSKELAQAHWDYLEAVLRTCLVEEKDVIRIGFHYRTAFEHGYKHGVEDCVTN